MFKKFKKANFWTVTVVIRTLSRPPKALPKYDEKSVYDKKEIFKPLGVANGMIGQIPRS